MVDQQLSIALNNSSGEVQEMRNYKIAAVASAFILSLSFSTISAHAAGSGIASIYNYAGKKTANGERANPRGLTAAHKTLPFGTKVRVTNSRNGKSVVVRINDRGPFIRGRVIDVTPAGASVLGFSGLTQVSLAVIN